MPSIQDVADQINARLDQINTNTSNTEQNTGDIKNQLVQVNTKLSSIDYNMQAGFANLSQGLQVLSELQKITITLLDHHRKQNDTIICLLENNNEMLCGITRKFTQQLKLSSMMASSLDRIEGISERVNATEAGDYDRDVEMNNKIEECCPPELERLEKCPEPCPKPKFGSIKPNDTKYAATTKWMAMTAPKKKGRAKKESKAE